MKTLRRIPVTLLLLILPVLISCSQGSGDDVAQLRATIAAQNTQIASVQSGELATEESASFSATTVAQATQEARLAARQTEQSAALSATSTAERAAEATANAEATVRAEPTSLPKPTQTPPLDQLVTIELANQGVVEDMFGKSLHLIFRIDNKSDEPVDVEFGVRFYDEAGTMSGVSGASFCGQLFGGLPYIPPHSQTWATASSASGDPLPASHRVVDIQVSAGCRMDRSAYYEAFLVGTIGEETVYDQVTLTSPEVKLEPGSGVIDWTTATLEGLLENTGSRDTSTVYVQATGFDANGLPIFETVVLHYQPIPPGEKMRLSALLYSIGGPAEVGGPIGKYDDIISWKFVASAMTLVTEGSQGLQ